MSRKYSFLDVENASHDLILAGVGTNGDPNYIFRTDREDRYYLIYLLYKNDKLTDEDLPYFLIVPDFRDLYLLSDQQLIQVAQRIFGPDHPLVHRTLLIKNILYRRQRSLRDV